MIYNHIDFNATPFSYRLDFSERITLVRGDSATGKTYLFNLLQDVKLLPEYKALVLFNYQNTDFKKELLACRNKCIVIDNADILLDEECKAFINFESSNQYLLFMRNCDGLNLGAGSFTILDEKNSLITLKRELPV